MTGAAVAAVAHPHAAALPRTGRVRVSGVLTEDAQICPTTGSPAHALLVLHLQPPAGLPYTARVDLGTDVADHMLAHIELPRMRRGAVVSVAGDGLEPRTDHGHASLRLVNARDAVLFTDPIHPTQAQEG